MSERTLHRLLDVEDEVLDQATGGCPCQGAVFIGGLDRQGFPISAEPAASRNTHDDRGRTLDTVWE